MCLVAGVESPSLPSETARLARPAGRLRRGALSGTVKMHSPKIKTLTPDRLSTVTFR